MQAALRHQCQQSDGFQRDGFAAGVGAGDDHGIEIRTQPQRDRHHGFGVDERMPRVTQLHPALIVHNGRPCTHPVGKLGLGKDHVQLHQHPVVQIDGFPVASGFAGQLRQNPLDFLLFL